MKRKYGSTKEKARVGRTLPENVDHSRLSVFGADLDHLLRVGPSAGDTFQLDVGLDEFHGTEARW
jgi:hypothetical protein